MKKLKSIWLTVFTVILSVAMLIGTASVSAFAFGYDNTNITPADTTTVNAAAFAKKLTYGTATAAFKGAKKVVTPNGTEITGETALASYVPLEVGAYTVYYGENNEYSYTVPCVLAEEYELRVENNGADIPTYMQKGKTFTLPKAALWVESETDSSGYISVGGTDFEVYAKVVNLKDNGKITHDGIDTTDAVPADGKSSVLIEKPGTYTVHYFCKVKNGTKYISKDFNVKVQNSFNDTSIPKLTFVNLSKEISLNTKITLPKATATDDYDENVKITVSVQEYNKETGEYADVEKVRLDKNGYAVEKTGEKEIFDNNFNLAFYPTEPTKYKVTYTAVDDNGNMASGVHSYEVTAVDKTAPLLVNIDDEQIPATYGIKSVTRGANKNETDKKTVTNSAPTITFPYPEYVDNSNKTPSVSFEIKDTHNNHTVLKITNIYAEDTEGVNKDRQYIYNKDLSSNGLYPEDLEFVEKDGKKGLTVNFAKYAEALKDESAAGSYTVTYRASDGTNSVSKPYEITLEDNYSDLDSPNPKIDFSDDYLLFTASEEDFVIPKPVINESSARPSVKYLLYSNNKADSIEVEGGETAQLMLDTNNVAHLTIKDNFGADKILDFDTGNATDGYKTDNLFYEITVTDAAGNVSVLTNDPAVDDYEEDPITVVSAAALAAPGAITWTDSDAFKTASYKLEQGKDTNIGGFTFSVANELREFYGFELSLVKDGELWSAGKIKLQTHFEKGAGSNAGKVFVDDITLAAPSADDFALYIRVFNVAGMSVTTKVDIGLAENSSTKPGDISALSMPTKGNVYATYTLKNRTITSEAVPTDIDTNKLFIVREIKGVGKFSLMGTQFTAYSAGSFSFVDKYYKKGVATPVTFEAYPGYTLTVNEDTTPAWQVQDEMPSYAAKDSVVTLPKVVASAEYANAVVKFTVTDPDGHTLDKIVPDDVAAEENKFEAYDVIFNNLTDKNYTFKATKDGTYTVSYTAYYGSGKEISQEFSIKAGDVIAPIFTLDTPPATRATENDTFKFSVITLGAEDSADAATTRYVKTLKAPDGSTVYTVDGTGEPYRTATVPNGEKAYTFTKTGYYTVEYVVYDKVGNSNIERYMINVSAAKVNNPVSTKIISTVLIIVGVLLIAGVILYFVRFRKVKSK